MGVKRYLLIGLGALLVLAVAASLAFASDPSPAQEPQSSPFFEATLQQAVNELDGKAQPPAARPGAQPEPTRHYTTDPALWPECQFGYTRDLVHWPWCHFTSDPADPDCEADWPTKDYTWDATIWPECSPPGGPGITQDPNHFWCNPTWTHDPVWGMQCADPAYTRDTAYWPWCNPRYTSDPAQWPNHCFPGPPFYTTDPQVWPECDAEPTSDPYLWPECHYTSDSQNLNCTTPYPTQDYTSNPEMWPGCPVPDPEYTMNPIYWPWCNPAYTSDPQQWPECTAGGNNYTQDPQIWPWCNPDPNYTTNVYRWPVCHYTSDPARWPQCQQSYPTRDYTWDYNLWPECDDPAYTQDPLQWPWCNPVEYTSNPQMWPWCAPNWTWDPQRWPECRPGYTNDPGLWRECKLGLYTSNPEVWPECRYYTADARIWPECHYTSDPTTWPDCDGTWYPTKDYTTDTQLWPECDVPPGYTSDPTDWPECHYTSDPATWPECVPEEEAELGDAPDSTNHFTPTMTAYPAGGPPGTLAHYPTVYDPATGLPQGPKHFNARSAVWLGPWVTLEGEADLMPPDEDGVTNIDPPGDMPDRDGADDGLLFPVARPHCVPTVISYTVTAVVAGQFYVNVWFDWNRDGDWGDVFTCTRTADAPEWAVQNQVIAVLPGTYIFQTPAFLPYDQTPDDPIWMRISIAEQTAPVASGTDLADGQGPPKGYELGETEDYYLRSQQEPEYDIYLKDNAADDGSVVPSSSPWWNSPDIWVRHDGDCTNTAHQNPVPGAAETVCVRVRNRLTNTVTNITVNVYWANAALALSWPASWSFISSFNIPSLAGGATTVQSVVWNVPFITGHFCLLARADALEDPLPTGPDTIAPVDSPKNNNNIAQRNTNVVDYPEITACGIYTTTVATDTVYFDAVNTWNVTKTVDIRFDSDDFPLGSGVLIIEPGSLWGRWTSLTNLNQIGTTLRPTAFPATMGGIDMAPNETARMTMTIAAEIDERFTVSIEEWVGSVEVGGIEYVRDLPRCVYLPIILKSYP